MSTCAQPPQRDVFVIGASTRAYDASALWRAEERGPAGWEYQLSRSKQLALEFAGVAAQALCCAGVDAAAVAGCTVASTCGFAHLAEWIHRRLAARGPAWIDPEAFVYCQPHAVTALACMQLGLSGSAMTMIGPHAGRQAVGHALRALARERQAVQIVGAYEVFSPAAARSLAALGLRTEPDRARAAFAVLASRARGSRRSVRLQWASGRWPRVDDDDAGGRPRPASAPLLALVGAYRGSARSVSATAVEGGIR
jgi:3-oxoacyl-(acyl-carrier-protein) synthase